MQDEINFGCGEEFAELCALSTSGCLSVGEEDRLEAHVAVCAQCALLLNQYRTLASAGMAKIAAVRATDEASDEKLHNASHLKAKLLSTLAPLQDSRLAEGAAKRSRVVPRLVPEFQPLVAAAMAATIVLAVIGGYFVGAGGKNQHIRSLAAVSNSAETALKQQITSRQMQLTVTQRKLTQLSRAANMSQTRSEQVQRELNDLQNEKVALEEKVETLITNRQTQNAAVAELTTERDTAVQKLSESDGLLKSVQQELKDARDDRQRSLLRTASLESQVDAISAQMQEQEAATRRDEQYLAADRDVRDLMTARQLYIADVFDVDPRGKTRKPFGRVFYTKGKSLIFYAFDLDQQPGYREAKTFQVWGRSGSSETKPVSLGIFYLDSKENRRWALKYDDPKVLEEINALFVTVEPKGGSKRPTNKPFLLAYLHATAPNHP
jgi:Anti-sigma-K factor rskA